MKERRGIRGLIVKDIYINPDMRFAWVTNPKVASTSIRKSLCEPAQCEQRAYQLLLADQVLGRKIPLQDVIAKINRLFTFAFVRHPEARLVSAYKNKIARKMGDRQVYRPKSEILRFLGYDPYDINREVTFDQFLSVVLACEPDQMDRHWRPQSMVLDVDRIRFSYIGKLETFEASWRDICDSLGLDLTRMMQFLSQAGKGKQSKAHLVNPDISPAQRSAIRALYREDFDRFQYD